MYVMSFLKQNLKKNMIEAYMQVRTMYTSRFLVCSSIVLLLYSLFRAISAGVYDDYKYSLQHYMEQNYPIPSVSWEPI